MTLAQLLDYEPLRDEGKLIYIRLNIPTPKAFANRVPCPPRGTVPVNSKARFFDLVSSQRARIAFGEGCDCSRYVGSSS